MEYFSKYILLSTPSGVVNDNLDLIEHYQLMKELLPAEWLPINMTVIFFLGASRVTPTDWATATSPRIETAGDVIRTIS